MKHISDCDEQIIGVLRVVIRTLKSSLKLILFEINVILTGTAFHFSVFIIMFRLQNFQRELDFIFDQLCFVYRLSFRSQIANFRDQGFDICSRDKIFLQKIRFVPFGSLSSFIESWINSLWCVSVYNRIWINWQSIANSKMSISIFPLAFRNNGHTLR